jgi:hypothetical protein
MNYIFVGSPVKSEKSHGFWVGVILAAVLGAGVTAFLMGSQKPCPAKNIYASIPTEGSQRVHLTRRGKK